MKATRKRNSSLTTRLKTMHPTKGLDLVEISVPCGEISKERDLICRCVIEMHNNSGPFCWLTCRCVESRRVSKKVDPLEAALLELEAYDCDRISSASAIAASSSASPQNDGEKERKNNDDGFQCEDMDDFIDKGASETVAVEQREGGVVPFIVDDFRHFRQANHAFRLLENMNDNGDGPIDIYDHSGVRVRVRVRSPETRVKWRFSTPHSPRESIDALKWKSSFLSSFLVGLWRNDR